MKRKVNINRPEISSAEIAKRKNFDSVLKQTTSVGAKPLIKKPWFLSSVVAVTIAIVTTVVLMNQNNKTDLPVADNQQQISDSLALQAFYKAEEAKPCIAPPIKGLNVEYTTFKVIAEKGATLEYKNCSKIIIPKNAFADENGKLLKGEVELRYREFHDAVDFFVSGIPMTYDSAGVKYQFESAGMVEVLAYQNGKQVQMAPKKAIDIEMASDYNGTEYNFYKLDTVANNWSCLGKDKVKPYNKELESKEDKFNTPEVDADAVLAVVKATSEYKTLETKKVEAKKEKVVEMAALPKPIAEPMKPAQVKKGKPTFDLDVNPVEFPELSIYKGLLFEVGDENTNFNTSMYDITWDEAAIKEGTKNGENYNLTLKKGLKKYDLIVYPVFEGKNYETAMKTYQEKFNKYKVTLDKRIAEEKRIEEAYQKKIALIAKQQEEMIKKQEQAMLNANSNMGTVRLREVESQFKQGTEGEKVFRMFTVNSFGVFNSDNPSLYPQGLLCGVNLKSDEKKSIKCYDVYLVDKKRNALFAYYKNPVFRFSFNPKSKSMLWTVEDGVLYWMKPEQFDFVIGSERVQDVVLTKVDQQFKNVEEMKAYFNF